MSGPFGAGGLNFFSGERTFYPFSLDNSLRFDDDVSSNLKRTPTTSTNRRTFAWSGWVKRCELGSGQGIFGTATGSATEFFIIQFTSSDTIFIQGASTPSSSLVENVRLGTDRLFRDPSAWYHIAVIVDTTQATASNRLKLYVNGDLITDFTSGNATYPTTQNFETPINSSSFPIQVGSVDTGTIDPFAGYMAEVNFIDAPIFTAATTSGSATVTGISSTATLKEGMAVSSSTTSVIPDGTTIQSIDSSTQITLSANATATNGSVSLTFNATIDFFGETKEGIWVAKEYLGPYGTNGFRLNFSSTGTAAGFTTVTFTGTGAAQSLTGVGFQPDFVWLKDRTGSSDHVLYDSLRGVNAGLVSNSTAAENTASSSTQDFVSFDSDGFSVGIPTQFGSTGSTGKNIVAWNWEAGGAPSADNSAGQGNVPTAGSVKIDGSNSSSALSGTLVAKRISANTTYGFSIITFNSGSTDNVTLDHGLGAVPKWIITRPRDNSGSWVVYHAEQATDPSTGYLVLNDDALFEDDVRIWNDTMPTSTLVTLGNVSFTFGDNKECIMYCWSEISGYSKFGGYTGNGSSGHAITTGFAPAWLMVKRVDPTGSDNSWYIVDNTRTANMASGNDDLLYANLNNAEGSTNDFFTFTSTGFELNTSSPAVNTSGGEYIYMAFKDTRTSGFYLDQSGNGNNFSALGLEFSDAVPDSPTNNSATFNALVKDLKHSTTLSNGNKTISFTSGSSGFSGCPMTIFRNEGKAYCEVELDRTYNGNSGDSQTVFVVSEEKDFSDIGSGDSSNFEGSYNAGGSSDAAASINDSGVNQGTPTKFRTAGDRVGVFVDFDTGKGFFSLNGTVQTVNGTPDVANGTNPHFTFTPNIRLTVGVGGIHAGTPAILTLKDDPSTWETTPPTGYTSFSTANLQDPDIDPNQGEAPDEYFNTVTYTGAGGTQAITGVGFQPDWVWAKARNVAFNHRLYDVVRGVSKRLDTASSGAESTENGVISFDSDGFTAAHAGTNNAGNTFVAWNWKAGGAASNNTDGTLTSQVSASTESGFSIVTYTGSGTNGDTVGHGLNSAPKMIFIKSRVATSADGNWIVYAKAGTAGFGLVNETDYLLLNSTVEATDAVGAFNDTAATSTVFSLGTFPDLNQSTKTYVAYCFAEKEGYCRVGTYIGTGGADGQFVYTGFRPAWVLMKRTSTSGSWKLFDNKRPNPFNVIDARIEADNNGAESTSSSYSIDLISNGFKLRGSSGEQNGDGSTFIYLALAEQPFKYSNAR